VASTIPDQEPVLRIPDEEDIVNRTISPDSEFFYPRLMARYMQGDETLTAEDYHYLYYGYAYEPGYDSHRPLPGENAILEIFVRTDATPGADTPTREDALEILAAAQANMLVDPFNPGNVNMMTYAYELIGDTTNAQKSADRFRGIVGAITSSGTGRRESSPWHILRFSHANDIVGAMGLRIANRQVRSRTVEYIQVEKNDAGVRGYFFNYDRVYWKPFDGPRIEKDHKWEFNGIPL
jgi:hypothetical protein